LNRRGPDRRPATRAALLGATLELESHDEGGAQAGVDVAAGGGA
jgi:hypothetical protein